MNAAKRIRRLFALLLLSVPILAILAAGLHYYVGKSRYADTSNAYIKADKIVVSAEITGRVASIHVDENHRVQAGQNLFQIDKEPFQIALDKAEANLARVRQNIDALRAQYRQKQAELRMAEGEAGFYGGESKRQQKLRTKGFASQARFDESERNFHSARERVNAIKEEAGRLLALLGGSLNLPSEQHPQVREAVASRNLAALNLRRTTVSAPVRSVVTNFNLRAGEYVEAGRPVFSLIGTEKLWIEANFKETDLTNVVSGQPATVKVDTYPGKTFSAVVTGISPATGAEFALLPPQNATGNWVKVVQRIPVRLRLADTDEAPSLRAGMSVSVKIDTGHSVPLPGFLSALFFWTEIDTGQVVPLPRFLSALIFGSDGAP